MFAKRMKEYIKELKDKLIRLAEAQEKDSEEYLHMNRQMAALNELKRYYFNGDWTRKSSREKYIALVRSNYDYKLIAERYKNDRASLQVFASRQDKRLYKAIGGAFELIIAGYIEEGLARFYADSGTMSKQEFTYSMSDLLPVAHKKDSFSVADCLEEVEILCALRRRSIQKRLNRADYDKLAYLMFLLEAKDPVFQQQKRELVAEIIKKTG